MKKSIILLLMLFMSAYALTVSAASQHVIWNESYQSLPSFLKITSITQLIKPSNNHLLDQHHYQLKLQNPTATDHARYQLTFKGIPIFGYQLIVHKRTRATPLITGMTITDIESDLNSIEGTHSPSMIEQKILATWKQPIKFKTIHKIIFIDEQTRAHVAYHLSFYTYNQTTPLCSPNYIVDANTGDILKQWDNAHHAKVGQGMGGNALMLPYRSGSFQYGGAIPGLLSLGRFDIDINNGYCAVQNDSIRIISLDNTTLSYNAFPVSISDENEQGLHAFSYPCDEKTLYLNFADGGSSPVNYAFSPINDTMFFAQNTINMYTIYYSVKQPLGNDLPLRAFTHINHMNKAFAIPSLYEKDQLVAHQQIVIGNGGEFLTAQSQSIIGHELSHNFTALNAGLLYTDQSGGINESFSDMAVIALLDYIRQSYPWYWNGKDWTIAREAVINGEPMRYMDNPTKDGNSIDHAEDYVPGLDAHYSSGIFNKAFYVLAHQPGWSIRKAFQVMVDANQHYWQPRADFNFAACGVIQAAIDRSWDKNDVISSFSDVGVSCKNIS